MEQVPDYPSSMIPLYRQLVISHLVDMIVGLPANNLDRAGGAGHATSVTKPVVVEGHLNSQISAP
jgi:hypothetical protein